MQIELSAQSQPGDSKDIVRSFRIAANQHLCLNLHWTESGRKNCKGTAK